MKSVFNKKKKCKSKRIIDDATDYPRITERLLREGFTRDDLAKLWAGNALRVLGQAQAAAKP